MNKEECSEKCLDLHAFQEAIVQFDEKNISEFRLPREDKADSR